MTIRSYGKMGYVDYSIQEDVGIVVIDRPEALNALNTQVLDDLESVIDAIDTDAIRAVLITGSGERSFAAGADIKEMSDMTRAQALAYGKKGNDLFLKIENFPVPVIAVVNGFCLGGGCELAMSCDIRICSENAMFGQPETGLGITPGYGGTQRLARIVNVAIAKEMLFTASNIKAQRALQIGLVNAVYPQEQLMDEALKLAKKIAKNAPIAVRACKKAVNEGLRTSIDKGIEIEEKLFSGCFESEDQREGMKAFLEKRKVKRYNNR